jgi:hypothetical protein
MSGHDVQQLAGEDGFDRDLRSRPAVGSDAGRVCWWR